MVEVHLNLAHREADRNASRFDAIIQVSDQNIMTILSCSDPQLDERGLASGKSGYSFEVGMLKLQAWFSPLVLAVADQRGIVFEFKPWWGTAGVVISPTTKEFKVRWKGGSWWDWKIDSCTCMFADEKSVNSLLVR